jgi:hypothetical protein
VNRRGLRIFYTIGSQMAVGFRAYASVALLPPGRILVLISGSGRADPGANGRLQRLNQ